MTAQSLTDLLIPAAPPREAGRVRGETLATPHDATTASAFSPFWYAYWLAAALCATKLYQLGSPPAGAGARQAYAWDVLVVTARDNLFALCLGLLGWVLIAASGSRPRLRRVAWNAWRLACAACVLYALVSVPVFGYLRSPATYQLLYLAGDARSMRSSIGAFLSPALLAALALGPVAYVLLAAATSRFVGMPRRRFARAALALTVLLVAGQQLAAANPGDRWRYLPDHRLRESPHWAMAASCVSAGLGRGAVCLGGNFPPENLRDFQTFAERGPATRPAIPLPGRRPRNVILVVLESTGTQHLGLYGSPYATTPNLLREASHAAVFDNVYANVGLTASALVPLTISTYPTIGWRHDVQEHPALPGVSLAQRLKPLGYRTAFMSGAELSYCGQDAYLSHRGFDVVRDNRWMGDPLNSWGSTDARVVERAFEWIDEAAAGPFFLVAWTNQSHHPYDLHKERAEVQFVDPAAAPPGVDPRSLNRYLNTLLEADRQLGAIFYGLRLRGLADDTLVVVTGDHGETFGSPHDTHGHGHQVWEESLHVPAFFWNPRLFDGRAVRSPSVGGHVDLNPTIADLLGVDPPAAWQGHSLFDPSRPDRAYFFAASHDYLLGVREGDHKFVYNATTGYSALYDLRADPREQANVADRDPQRCERLRGHVAAWAKGQNGQRNVLRDR